MNPTVQGPGPGPLVQDVPLSEFTGEIRALRLENRILMCVLIGAVLGVKVVSMLNL